MIFDIRGVSLSGVRLGQSPNLRQLSGDFGRISDILYGGEWHGWIGPLIECGVHKVLSILVPLEFLFVRELRRRRWCVRWRENCLS